MAATELTDTLVGLFTPPRGPSREEIRSHTTVQFICYEAGDLFVGGIEANASAPDVTVELSDWYMSTRQQRKVAEGLTPVLMRLFGSELDATNIRFHPYPPSDFSVGGRLLQDRVPRAGRTAKRIFG